MEFTLSQSSRHTHVDRILGKNEAIVIGNEIIVTMLAVRDDEVEIEIGARRRPVEWGSLARGLRGELVRILDLSPLALIAADCRHCAPGTADQFVHASGAPPPAAGVAGRFKPRQLDKFRNRGQ